MQRAPTDRLEESTNQPNRREFLRGSVTAAGGALLGLAAASTSCSGVDSTESPDTQPGGEAAEVELLFVQSAMGASIEDGKLKLTKVTDSTLYFSDRPERVVGHTPTDVFVDHWDKGDDSFASNPPNATLSILSGEMPLEVVLVLKAPKLESGVLTYEVEVLEGSASASGGPCSLFIDTIGRPMTPRSFAGRHRRVRRRVIR